ncbi:hypothetical protein [Paenibacillus sp. USHLN196]|uniref:hypothetical protein n=1 Tax=Paenibacillus sp. USHLN196 TaxID=3081291 RepID=UPI00301A0853
MIPKVGDVYCVYAEELQQYVACQVTGLKQTEGKTSDTLASVLQLDWTGDQLPNEIQLHQMKPLICNFYFWNDRVAHSFVHANVPPQYELAGNIPPLYTEETNTYGGGWPIGESSIASVNGKVSMRSEEHSSNKLRMMTKKSWLAIV